MRVLILGASGFVGGAIYEYFIHKGYKVDGTYNNNNSNKKLIHFSLDDKSDLINKIKTI